ncbi:MAG TPA: type II toxin-antitoxin system RelE/ParE family toxin [Acidimicrobiia bacterium]|nr:type II toxin-antitoxin system RelE/ParE family toxin [Acidimicrobiia bacterium]
MARRWRFYETTGGRSPVGAFLRSPDLPPGDRVEIIAAMKDVEQNGLRAARHLDGDIYEVRADGNRVTYRVLFAAEGSKNRILLALHAFNKKTQATPREVISLAKRRLTDWRSRGAN